MLEQIYRTLWYRRYLMGGVLIGALLMSPILAKQTQPLYQASSEILSVGNGAANNSGVLSLADISELALSTEVMKRAATSLHFSGTIDQLRSMVNIRTAARSNILVVGSQSKDGDLCLKVTNAMADAVVAGYHHLAGQQYNQVLTNLHRQIDSQSAVIASIDHRLQDAAQQDIVAASTHPLDSIDERLTSLQSERALANASFVADSAAASAQSAGGLKDDRDLKNVISEQILASDPYYQALRAGQSKDAAEYQFMRASFTKDYPGLPGLSSKVKAETSAVAQAAHSSILRHVGSSATYASVLVQRRSASALVAGDKARLDAIDHEITQTRMRLASLPKLGVPANQMRLQRDSASAAYQQLETRLQMTLADQQQAASLNSVIVLNYATGVSPKVPRARLVFMMLLTILGLAIGSAFAAEFLNPRLRTKKDIEELYGRPLLGSLG